MLLIHSFILSFRFDLQLNDFGVDINELKKPATERVFRAWVEDWEWDCITKNDIVPMSKLQQKYKGLKFADADNENIEVCITGLEWRRKNKKQGIKVSSWFFTTRDENGEEEDWEINDDNCDTIASYPQAPGIEVERKTEEQLAMELEAQLEDGSESDD